MNNIYIEINYSFEHMPHIIASIYSDVKIKLERINMDLNTQKITVHLTKNKPCFYEYEVIAESWELFMKFLNEFRNEMIKEIRSDENV